MDGGFGFNVEWLPKEPQRYHGPRARMRETLRRVARRQAPLPPKDVVRYVVATFPDLVGAIRKLKFYEVPETGMTLRFFILWCDFVATARERYFELGDQITRDTGWYPMVTGNRVFHHTRPLVDYVDAGLRKAMNKSRIQALPGLGRFESISALSSGEGTSVLLRSSTYDLVLDAGMDADQLDLEALDPRRRKWLFLSHSHRDHSGGIAPFIRDRQFVISSTPMTLRLWLRAISGSADLDEYLPEHFFYRFASVWYRSQYVFADGSALETYPTYHFPGSAGFRFTFSDRSTVFYSGDMNVAATYLTPTKGGHQPLQGLGLGVPPTDVAILDGAFVGRTIGSLAKDEIEILDAVQDGLRQGRNQVLLCPPNDYGLFLFLHLYEALISSVRKVDTRLFLDPAILQQLEILEWSLKRKRVGELDDALMGFFARRSTLAESVRVYDASVNTGPNLREYKRRGVQVVAILDDRRFGSEGYLADDGMSLLSGPDTEVSLVGKGGTVAGLISGEGSPPRRLFTGGNWLLHTPEDILSSHLLLNPRAFRRVYIFHNFARRIERFSRTLKERGYKGEIMPLSRVTPPAPPPRGRTTTAS
jgi:hypothetical protein